MAKINISKGIGVRGLRVMVGLPGHRPSAFSRCVGTQLEGKSYPKPPPGFGGKNNPCVRAAFIEAVDSCSRAAGGQGIRDATRRKLEDLRAACSRLGGGGTRRTRARGAAAEEELF